MKWQTAAYAAHLFLKAKRKRLKTKTMTITKAQAMTAEYFHRGVCTRTVGPKGGETFTIETWRRNGKNSNLEDAAKRVSRTY